MFVVTEYNEDRDLGVVVPGLSTDLNDAIQTGTIIDTGVALEANNIDDTESIHGRVSDIFEALEYSKQKAKAALLKTQATRSESVNPTVGEES